jgi:hypothetical protein
MAIKTLTYALAAAAMTSGAIAQAAVPASVPARTGAPVGEADQLFGGEFLPVAIFMLAILAIMLFDGDGGDVPVSP